MNYIDKSDTICAPATSLGSGAVSIIRVSGEKALEYVDRIVEFRNGDACGSKGGRIKFGSIYNDDSSLLDEVLVSVFHAPHSYTGENAAEISCHASSYIASEILRLLCKAGCRMALPGEFTQRAFINGKMDLTQAEAVADVIAASTKASHKVAVGQLKGGFSSELARLREQLLEMASLLELELDFSEEDVEFAERGRLNSLVEKTLARVEGLAKSFRLGNAIKNGVPVTIVGATNAGKSTLLNAILGENRAIVSDIAGTTRDTIEQSYNIDGVLFRFIDTAGIRESSDDVIENIGIERSFQSIEKAEIVLLVVDSLAPDYDSITSVLEKIDFESQQLIMLLNKCDEVVSEASAVDRLRRLEDGFEEENGDLIGENGLNKHENRPNKNVTNYNNIVSFIENKVDSDVLVLGDLGEPGSDNSESFADEICNFGDENSTKLTENGAGLTEAGLDEVGMDGVGMDVVGMDGGSIGPIGTVNKLPIMKISAKTGKGMDALLGLLANTQQSRLASVSEDSVLVTNLRHYQAFLSAADSLRLVQSGLSLGSPTDLVAEDLRSALTTLGSITGTITTTDILSNIFKNFCVGK